ncbi:MAG: hypothetical protein CVU29_05035 [Betaproteobacteria bacterium HGW-Betaproteobacteria-22]|nr:MAG: hypothetical protein CVU29_05035 [Betaproteobacteria bacterium HGW-Betaproteobacteria-22]
MMIEKLDDYIKVNFINTCQQRKLKQISPTKAGLSKIKAAASATFRKDKARQHPFFIASLLI